MAKTFIVSCTLLSLVACAAPEGEDAGTQEGAAIADTQTIERRTDGLFDVTCRDGRHEVANESEITANTVCAPVLGLPAADRAVALAVAHGYACAIDGNAHVRCWGQNNAGQLDVPPNLEAKAIAAGPDVACAVRLDQGITCWGSPSLGLSNVPSGRFTAVATSGREGSDSFACALRESGEIACWGESAYVQLEVPAGRFKAIAARQRHACALSFDGEVKCWGQDLVTLPRLEGTFTDLGIATVATCGLTESHSITCVNAPNYDNLQPPAGTYSKISGGAGHACALALDGHITCWGSDGYEENRSPEGKFTDVVAGHQNNCGLRASGKVTCWGQSLGPVPAPFAE